MDASSWHVESNRAVFQNRTSFGMVNIVLDITELVNESQGPHTSRAAAGLAITVLALGCAPDQHANQATRELAL
jgi:hypothetical protein